MNSQKLIVLLAILFCISYVSAFDWNNAAAVHAMMLQYGGGGGASNKSSFMGKFDGGSQINSMNGGSGNQQGNDKSSPIIRHPYFLRNRNRRNRNRNRNRN